MEQSGHVIQAIRRARGMTAEQVYDGVTSRTNYARFEKGQIDTSTGNVYEFTRRLDVAFPEWDMMMADADGEQAQLAKQFTDLSTEGLLHQSGAPFRQAAKLFAASYAKRRSPGLGHMVWVCNAQAVYYDHHADVMQPNYWRDRIVSYLDASESWFPGDVTILFDVLELMSPATALRLIRQYLTLLNQNPGLASAPPVSPGQILYAGMISPVRMQNWAIFQELLNEFDQLPLDEGLTQPVVMRAVYNSYGAYQSGDTAALDWLPDLLDLLQVLDLSVARVDCLEQIERLDAWFRPGQVSAAKGAQP